MDFNTILSRTYGEWVEKSDKFVSLMYSLKIKICFPVQMGRHMSRRSGTWVPRL